MTDDYRFVVCTYTTNCFLSAGTSITSDDVAMSDNVTLHSTDLSTHHFRQDQDLSVYLGAYCAMYGPVGPELVQFCLRLHPHIILYFTNLLLSPG